MQMIVSLPQTLSVIIVIEKAIMLVPIVDKPLCNLLFQAAFVDHPLVITTMKVLKCIPSAQYASVMSTNHNRLTR